MDFDFAHAIGRIRTLRAYLGNEEIHAKLVLEGVSSEQAHLLMRAAEYMDNLFLRRKHRR